MVGRALTQRQPSNEGATRRFDQRINGYLEGTRVGSWELGTTREQGMAQLFWVVIVITATVFMLLVIA